jgi:multidrug resistance efflux pump
MKRPNVTQNRVLATIVVATGLILAAGAFVLWPTYINPESRIYTTSLGFLKVQRMLGIRLPVTAEHPVWHDFEMPLLGEGTMQCNFYNVAIVPTTRVVALHVEEGDKVKAGQLLAELDDTTAILSLSSAELAARAALAEGQRVEAGSVNNLEAERPEKDRIELEGVGEVVKKMQAKVEMYRRLQAGGAASRLELVNAEIELQNARTDYNQARTNTAMSSQGFPESRKIARDVITQAQNSLQQQKEAIKYYRVYAPAVGTIQSVLIRDGEYNQFAGSPGFVIASGLWFETNLDQQAIAEVHAGMEASVNLEAYAGRTFRATVERVVPFVTFNAGGPETNRPVRPLGTGSPEWPATFKVRLRVQASGAKLTPGMTGFARIIAYRDKVLALPREAVTTLSAGKGMVRTVDTEGHHTGVPVSLGAVDEHFVEITEGIDSSAWVLTQNPRFLRDDDKLNITRRVASKD